MVFFAVCVESCADRTLIGGVFNERRLEETRCQFNGRGELDAAVGADEEELIFGVANGGGCR